MKPSKRHQRARSARSVTTPGTPTTTTSMSRWPAVWTSITWCSWLRRGTAARRGRHRSATSPTPTTWMSHARWSRPPRPPNVFQSRPRSWPMAASAGWIALPLSAGLGHGEDPLGTDGGFHRTASTRCPGRDLPQRAGLRNGSALIRFWCRRNADMVHADNGVRTGPMMCWRSLWMPPGGGRS